VQVDFSVELGADAPSLELPWASSNTVQYYDLKLHPELLPLICEAVDNPELRDFLRAINSHNSFLETAKCDTWISRELDAEDELFGAALKFASYIDLVAASNQVRFAFDRHEELLRKLVGLLQRVPEIPAAAEFVLRRCYFHGHDSLQEGFYITFYLAGYGDEDLDARQHWAIALKLVENAILQLSAQLGAASK
jgi:hypothetical protein